MNEQDLHDILEKINEKDLAKNGMRDWAQNLGAFRNQLRHEGFSEIESFVLTYSFMMTTLGRTEQ